MAITNSCAAGRAMPCSKNYRNIYHAQRSRDSPMHRRDRTPNLAHRILPFRTKGVEMTLIRGRYIINQRYRHKDQLSCLALSPYQNKYDCVNSVRTCALFQALEISLSVNMTRSTIKDGDLRYINRVHIRYILISLENRRRPQCPCIALRSGLNSLMLNIYSSVAKFLRIEITNFKCCVLLAHWSSLVCDVTINPAGDGIWK